MGRPTRAGSARTACASPPRRPASGANRAPGHGAAAGGGGGKSGRQGRKKRGSSRTRQQGWRGASRPVPPPRGSGHHPAFPLPGQCLGRRGTSQRLDTRAQGPPAAHTPQPPAFLARALGTQGRTSVLLPIRAPTSAGSSCLQGIRWKATNSGEHVLSAPHF